jgi:hypothetical protein
MYCPKCGKRQVSDEIRFCAKCGLSLEPVTKLVTTGSVPTFNPSKRQLSPRTKGILQGVAIVPASVGAWLLLDIFYEGVFGAGMMGGLYAMLTLILLVALLRILYALFQEEGPTRLSAESALPYRWQDEISTASNNEAVPAITSEIAPPISVTEKTTKQLDTRR